MKNRNYLSIFISLIFFTFIFSTLSCIRLSDSNGKKSDELIIFHAGSLSVPVKQICDSFRIQHPDVILKSEAAGSVASARKITDLKRDCDVFLSADYVVIDKFLIPEHASWNVKFASNEMAIVFTGKSRYSQEIDSSNWQQILQREDVNYGRSDPNSDPCGYRTVISLKLAGKIFQDKDFANHFLNKDQRFVRPKEVDLIALLETQTVDYIFIYRSVAVQHKLKFITLPDSLNLGNPSLANWYNVAEVEINGMKPGEKIIQKGEPMIYGLTIPDKSKNHDLAVKFCEFLLNENKGMKIMRINGQPSLIPEPARGYEKMPKALQKYANP